MTAPWITGIPVHVANFGAHDPQSTGCDVLLWDGRLDNRADLIVQLNARLLNGQDDASLAKAVYDQWGVDGLRRLIGDWRIAIRDRRTAMIVLAVDFAGIRPLYYTVDDDGITFSAGLHPLVRQSGAAAVDERFIAAFIVFGGCPDRTPFEGVCSVAPGHAVCISADGTRSQRFWNYPVADECRYRDESRYVEQLQMLFREAVAVRLRSPRVIAELSGGLDSSSVVCVAHRLIATGAVTGTELQTLSYVHPGSRDLPFITTVQSACPGQGVHLALRDAPLFAAGFGADIWNASPLMSAAARATRERGATGFLTGQAGDTLLGNWIDDSVQIARHLRQWRVGRAGDEALAWSQATGVPVVRILARALRPLLPGATSHSASGQNGPCAASADETSLTGALHARAGVANLLALFSSGWLDAPVERRSHFRALTMTLEQRVLQAPDSMHGIGYTHPFLHRPLVEFLMTIPADMLCRPGQPRYLMRRALSPVWPDALQRRRSKGLLTKPYLDAFRPFVSTLLKERAWQVVERGWVDHDSLRSRLERLLHGLDGNQSQLRQILIVEDWLRRLANGATYEDRSTTHHLNDHLTEEKAS